MAEKVTLRPYPFPDGMEIPRLMPYQEYPWNGDGYLAAEVLRLKSAHDLNNAVETGTCLGSTSLWFSEHFDTVTTFEVNDQFHAIAKARPSCDFTRINFVHRASVPGMSLYVTDNLLCFLDAHWCEHCPLLDELSCIARHGIKPCIVIHDFQVPGTDFGFDSMPDGRPFNLDLIRDRLDAIYGDGGWKYNYPTQVEGARRGWISIEPV